MNSRHSLLLACLFAISPIKSHSPYQYAAGITSLIAASGLVVAGEEMEKAKATKELADKIGVKPKQVANVAAMSAGTVTCGVFMKNPEMVLAAIKAPIAAGLVRILYSECGNKLLTNLPLIGNSMKCEECTTICSNCMMPKVCSTLAIWKGISVPLDAYFNRIGLTGWLQKNLQ